MSAYAAHVRWAKEPNRTLATETAREGLQRRFEVCVDPDDVLSPDERRKRVKNARSAYHRAIRSGGRFDWDLITAKNGRRTDA